MENVLEEQQVVPIGTAASQTRWSFRPEFRSGQMIEAK